MNHRARPIPQAAINKCLTQIPVTTASRPPVTTATAPVLWDPTVHRPPWRETLNIPSIMEHILHRAWVMVMLCRWVVQGTDRSSSSVRLPRRQPVATHPHITHPLHPPAAHHCHHTTWLLTHPVSIHAYDKVVNFKLNVYLFWKWLSINSVYSGQLKKSISQLLDNFPWVHGILIIVSVFLFRKRNIWRYFFAAYG